jgi:hypothetical protein
MPIDLESEFFTKVCKVKVFEDVFSIVLCLGVPLFVLGRQISG